MFIEIAKNNFGNFRNFIFFLVWHVSAYVFSLLIFTLLSSTPIWRIIGKDIYPFIFTFAIYFLSIFFLLSNKKEEKKSSFSEIFFPPLIIYLIGFVLLYFSGLENEKIIQVSLLLSLFLIYFYFLLPVLRIWFSPFLFLISFYLVAIHALHILDIYKIEREVKVLKYKMNVETNMHNLKIDSYENLIRLTGNLGGSLTTLGQGKYLLSTGKGHLYKFYWDDNDDFNIEDINLRIPINWETYSNLIEKIPRDKNNFPRDKNNFRVMDILTSRQEEKIVLYASHHFWKKNENCFVIRLSSLELSKNDLEKDSYPNDWKTFYETSPCLSIEPSGGSISNEAGGKLAFLDKKNLLLTIGNHKRDGVNTKEITSQNPDTSYGKVIKLNIENGEKNVFSTGFRNPSGIFVSNNQTIWLTDHGPKGGDEINIINENQNYGWPLVTYGVDYDNTIWPLNSNQGRHEGFNLPIMAWVPSIGVSNLIKIEQNLFTNWQEDIIVSSLRAKSLYRLRYAEGRIIFSEPIYIGYRIRDIIEGDDGRLILWTGRGTDSIISIQPSFETNEENLFAQRCSGCHSIQKNGGQKIGPNLFNVMNRDIGSLDAYKLYSDVLSKNKQKWDKAKLRKYLKDPQKMFPGTSMMLEVENEEELSSLISVLSKYADQ